MDVSVYQDGWTMLTSCDNFAPELASFVEANPMRKLNASRDELTSVASKSGEDKDSDRRLPSITALNHDLLNSYRVVLHHAKTGKGVTFRARAGCFRANTVIIAWYNDLEVASPTSEDQSKKLYSWKLMCISIPELLRYLQNSEREDGTSLKTALPMRSVSIRSGSDYVEQETSDALSCDWLISLPCESPSVVTPNYHTVESSKSESRASKASYRPVTAPLGYLYPLADRLFFLTNTGLLYELAEPRTKSETSIALNVMPSVLRLPSAGTVADSATSTAGKEIDSWIHSCALDTSGSDGPSLLLLQINCGLGASGSSSASASALQGSDSARIVRVFLKGASALLAKKRRQSK